MKKLMMILIAASFTGCMNGNKVQVPEDINVHVDPVVVKVELSGEAILKVLTVVSADQSVAKLIDQACKEDAACKDAKQQDLLGSISDALGQLNINEGK
jgi:hypothetical protein